MQSRNRTPAASCDSAPATLGDYAGGDTAAKVGSDGRVVSLHEHRARSLQAAITGVRKRRHRLRQLRVRAELSAGRPERELMELERELRTCRRNVDDCCESGAGPSPRG